MEDPRITQPLDVEISGFTDPQRSPSLDIGVKARDAPSHRAWLASQTFYLLQRAAVRIGLLRIPGVLDLQKRGLVVSCR
jgi:hypothetical protein